MRNLNNNNNEEEKKTRTTTTIICNTYALENNKTILFN
jgi:hypothetical protein